MIIFTIFSKATALKVISVILLKKTSFSPYFMLKSLLNYFSFLPICCLKFLKKIINPWVSVIVFFASHQAGCYHNGHAKISTLCQRKQMHKYRIYIKNGFLYNLILCYEQQYTI